MDARTIRALREAYGETQEEFAARLGLATRFAVSHLEAGRRAPKGPLLALLRYLAADAPRRPRSRR